MPARTYPVDGPLDLRKTLAPLGRGPGDRTLRFVGRSGVAGDAHAGRPGDGLARSTPATRSGRRHGVRARTRALAACPRWSGSARSAPALAGAHPTIAQLARRIPGVRIPRTGAVLESLVPAILEQKVIGEEARRALFQLVRRYGEPAPGPPELGMRLPPAPATLAGLPYYTFHPLGVERRRADLIRRVAARAAWFEAIVDLPLPEAYARLTAIPGIGPWTAAEVAVRALGRRGRGERRRLPPAEPGRLRPRRRAARPPTPACSSCSSRTAASGRSSSGCSS